VWNLVRDVKSAQSRLRLSLQAAFVLLLPSLLRRHLLSRFLLSAGRPCEETRLYTYYKALYCVGCVPTRRYKNWVSARLCLEQPANVKLQPACCGTLSARAASELPISVFRIDVKWATHLLWMPSGVTCRLPLGIAHVEIQEHSLVFQYLSFCCSCYCYEKTRLAMYVTCNMR
jgi:hypothetical protein